VDAAETTATHRVTVAAPPAHTPAAPPGEGERSLPAALAAARAALADQQDKEGGWTAVGAAGGTWWEAIDVLVHHLLDTVDPARLAQQRTSIVGRQNDDGGFPLRADGPSDLSCTLLTHVALQLVGHAEDRERLDRAARFTRKHGGIDAAGAEPARFWLAFTGTVGWDRTVPMPPELLLLPSWAAGAVDGHDTLDPTAHAIAAALGVLGSVRPVRELPVDTAPLHAEGSTRAALGEAAATAVLRTAHALGRRSPRPLRHKALREAERLLLNGRQPDGTWGGDPPGTAVCALALWALGHGTRHPAVGAALDALVRDDGSGDGTALVLRALAEAGDRAGSDPVVDRAVDRLLPARGDRTTHTPQPVGRVRDRGVLAPAGDTDGTALVLTALHRADAPRSRETDTAVAEAVRWLLERQSANGGRSRHGVRRRFPPGRRALTGPAFVERPAPWVTAHVVEALCAAGYAWHPAVRRALRTLLAQQTLEGFWQDRRGGRLHATTQVLLALDAAGVGAGHIAVEGAMEWIYQQQNPDGGWGDDAAYPPDTAAYAPDTAPRASGPSTVGQTARCVIAAHTTGVLDAPRVEAAVAFLLRHQGENGGWTGPGKHSAAAPDGTHPVADVRTDAYALWAIALHARHAESVRREEPVIAVPAEQEGRR
jgi:squalene-hopene/tetraprenyl-beta-curcumene cyclase